MARLVLRHQKLADYRSESPKLARLDVDQVLAHRMGIHPSQLSRVLSGGAAPGPRFIAGLLDVFGIDNFADLFEIRPDKRGM